MSPTYTQLLEQTFHAAQCPTIPIVFTISKGLYLAYHGYTPRYAYDPDTFTGDLEEVIEDIPWDSDTAPRQGRTMNRYKIVDVTLPPFIHSAAEYCRYYTEIRYFYKWIHPGKLDHRALTPAHYAKLWALRDNTEALFTIQSLLEKKRPRSGFINSLIQQVLDWLEDDTNQYPAPLSQRQMACAMRYKSHDYHCRLNGRMAPMH